MIEVKLIPLQCLCQVQNVDDRTEKPVVCRETNHEQGHQANQKFPKPNKKEPKIERDDPLFANSGRTSSEIPERLQELWGILVDDEILEQETLTPVLLMKF